MRAKCRVRVRVSEDTLHRSWGCTAAVHVPYGAGGRCDTAAAAGAAAAGAAVAAAGAAVAGAAVAAAAAAAAGGSALVEGW